MDPWQPCPSSVPAPVRARPARPRARETRNTSPDKGLAACSPRGREHPSVARLFSSAGAGIWVMDARREDAFVIAGPLGGALHVGGGARGPDSFLGSNRPVRRLFLFAEFLCRRTEDFFLLAIGTLS